MPKLGIHMTLFHISAIVMNTTQWHDCEHYAAFRYENRFAGIVVCRTRTCSVCPHIVISWSISWQSEWAFTDRVDVVTRSRCPGTDLDLDIDLDPGTVVPHQHRYDPIQRNTSILSVTVTTDWLTMREACRIDTDLHIGMQRSVHSHLIAWCL